MQSFVWFVSACRIWTGAVLWAFETEPEQITVCSEGWKIERGLSCNEGPRLHVSLFSNSHPREHRLLHILKHLHVPHVPWKPLHGSPSHLSFPFLNFKKPTPTLLFTLSKANTVPSQSQPYLLRENRSGIVPSSQLGRNTRFPNWKCYASVNWIALDAVRKRGRMVMMAHSAQLHSPH